jgi:hypothetical protein
LPEGFTFENPKQNISDSFSEIGERFLGAPTQALTNTGFGYAGFAAGAPVFAIELARQLISEGVEAPEAFDKAKKAWEYVSQYGSNLSPQFLKGGDAKRIAGEMTEAIAYPFSKAKEFSGKAMQYVEPGVPPERAQAAGEILFDVGAVAAPAAKAISGINIKGIPLSERFITPRKGPLIATEMDVPVGKPHYKYPNPEPFQKMERRPVQLEPEAFKDLRYKEYVDNFYNKEKGFTDPEYHPEFTGFAENLYNRSLKILGSEDHPLHAGLKKMEADVQLMRSEFDSVVADMVKVRGKVKGKAGEIADNMLYSSHPERWAKVIDGYFGDTRGSLAWQKFETARAKRGKEFFEVHPEAKEIPNYYPRELVDIKGYMEFLNKKKDTITAKKINDLIEELNTNKIDYPTFSERLNKTVLDKYQARLQAPSSQHAKARRMPTVPKELRKFYGDPYNTLQNYFNETGATIAERRFIGKGNVPIEESVKGLLADAVLKKQITEPQAVEYAKVLQTRFDPRARHHGAAYLKILKDIGYGGTIGNPLSGAMNVLDVFPAIAKYGLGNTLRAGIRAAIPGKNVRGMLEPSDIGLKNITHEIDSGVFQKGSYARAAKGKTGVAKAATYSGRILHDLLRPVFTPFDLWGKRTVMGAAMNKYAQMAKRGKVGDKWLADRGFKNYYKTKEQWESFKDALAKKDISDIRVREAAVMELFDVQPHSISSMPIGYSLNPNMRILYMLKTWALRQLNMIRESYNKGRKGEAVKLMAAVYGSAVGGTVMKDLIASITSDKELKEVSDYATLGLYRVALLSKFGVERGIQTGRATDVVGDALAPPTANIFFAIGHDLDLAISGITEGKDWDKYDLKSTEYTPWIGPYIRERNKEQR